MPEYDVLQNANRSKLVKTLAEKAAAGWELVGPVQCLSVGEGWLVATIVRPDIVDAQILPADPELPL